MLPTSNAMLAFAAACQKAELNAELVSPMRFRSIPGIAYRLALVAAGEGAIITSGTTSALRGKANFAGFAPTKAAQRILAESIARELGPKGVHVAYVLIDAVIDLEWTRKRFADAPGRLTEIRFTFPRPSRADRARADSPALRSPRCCRRKR